MSIGSGNGLLSDSTKPLPETVDLSSLSSSGFHPRAVSQEMLTTSVTKRCSKIVLHIATSMQLINSLWHTETIWLHRTGSTLDQLMAYCLTATSHYMKQCWLLISEVLWLSPDDNFTVSSQASNYSVSWVWKFYFWNYCYISLGPVSEIIQTDQPSKSW